MVCHILRKVLCGPQIFTLRSANETEKKKKNPNNKSTKKKKNHLKMPSEKLGIYLEMG